MVIGRTPEIVAYFLGKSGDDPYHAMRRDRALSRMNGGSSGRVAPLRWEEPFFATGFSFGDIPRAQGGKSVKVRFDARGRQIRSIRPDGAESWVVFGEVSDVTDPDTFNPTPWQTYAYDANDNAGRTTITGVDPTTFSGHHDTPTSTVVDALGRAIETVERTDAGNLVTQTTYDIRGNVLSVVDPKQRTAASQFYDLADRVLRGESIDAGTSIAAFDAAGTPVEARDERGALTLSAADEMLRPTHQWGRDTSTDPVRLVGRTLFGHEMGDPKATNHLGKPHRHFDEAGVVTLEAYDFKGNVLETTREVIDPQHMIDAVDAASSANNYVVDTFRVDWTPAANETLADRQATLIDNSSYRTAYKSKTIFDGLNRPVEMTLPADEDSSVGADYGKTITPRFNRAGALQSVAMSGTDTPSVDYIAYNARGQRILAALGNGVMTRYAYDENVFRLSRMRSEKYASTSTPETGYTLPSDGTGKKYQDIVYAYDAVGNILSTDERVTDVGVAGDDTMVREFVYDSLYRLIEATGRESDVQKTDPWQDQLTVKSMAGYDDSPQNTRQYTETYAYDEVGGLTQLVHDYGSPSAQWVRDYTTEAGSNRMTGLEVGGNTYTYAYDSGGNLVQENTERHFEWDFGGRMRAFRNQVSGSAPTVFAHYSYDGGGQRVQKVVCRGAKTTRTVYIGGVFEHQQVIENDAVTVENQTLHLMDDAKRIATYRVGGELDGVQRPKTRYHLGDHLQSSSVVLRQVPDVDGKLFVNREEYRPYGETAFGSFKYKRYRFTGKEKDEESGLHYHSARYYAPWAARWTAPDPMGMVDGPNLYQYVSGNPVRFIDRGGQEKERSTDRLSVFVEPGGVRVNEDFWPAFFQRARSVGLPTKSFLEAIDHAFTALHTRYSPSNHYNIYVNVLILESRTVEGVMHGFNSTNVGTLYHESAHAYMDIAANEKKHASVLDNARNHYAQYPVYKNSYGSPRHDPEPATDPERITQEAIGEYTGAKVSAYLTTYGFLESALYDTNDPNEAKSIFDHAVKSYKKQIDAAGYMAGYQPTDSGNKHTSAPLHSGIRKLVNEEVLEGKIPDNFYAVPGFQKLFGELQEKYPNVDFLPAQPSTHTSERNEGPGGPTKF
jgi:RHS repeat-associated protein